MEKLEKSSITFLHIMFAIWQAISYCAEAFWYSAPETVFDMDSVMFQDCGIIHFHIRVPRVRFLPYLRSTELREALQLYLNYATPSEIKLEPYRAGTGLFDIVEPLFVERVTLDPLDERNYLISIMYISDPNAFRYYKALQAIPKI